MAEYKSCVTSMEERLKLTKASTAVKVDATLYRSIVGSLRYLVHTRPDITFAVGYVSRFIEDTALRQRDGGSGDHLLQDRQE